MVSTLDLMQEHQLETGLSGKLLEEEIAFLYTGIRLRPIYGSLNLNKTVFDNICSSVVKHYIDEDYSLDCIINALYNYINKCKTYPPESLLCDNIEIFLKEYCKAIEDFTKRK